MNNLKNLELLHIGGDDLLQVDSGETEIRGKSVVPEQGRRLVTEMLEGPFSMFLAYFWRLFFDLNNKESSSLGKKRCLFGGPSYEYDDSIP